jgi:hypothetical protein
LKMGRWDIELMPKKPEDQKRTVGVLINLTPEEHAFWKSEAAKYGEPVNYWVRRRTLSQRGRLRPPRKPAAPRCAHGLIESRVCSSCNQAWAVELEAEQRLVAENQRIEAANRRRYQAQALAAAAGGVVAWLEGMTAKDRLKWADLEVELIKAEKLDREARESWERFSGQSQSPQSYERAAPRQAYAAPPECTFDGMPLDGVVPSVAARAILTRDLRQERREQLGPLRESPDGLGY